VKILGKGSFGLVKLIIDMGTNEMYALKILSKERIRGQKHIQHVMNEKTILQRLKKKHGEVGKKKSQPNDFFVNF
jgi:serine/threonine protein kinase